MTDIKVSSELVEVLTSGDPAIKVSSELVEVVYSRYVGVPPLHQAILSLSPELYWPMDEPSGITIVDYGSTGADGTYQRPAAVSRNQAQLMPGASAASTQFPGATGDDWFNVPGTTAAGWTSGWTLSVVAKLSSAASGGMIVSSFWDNTGIGGLPISAGVGVIESVPGSSADVDDLTVSFYNGAWRGGKVSASMMDDVAHHIVYTWSGSQFKIWVDGSLAGTVTPSTSMTACHNSTLRIGRRWDATPSLPQYVLKGDVSDLAMWGHKLTDTEIGDLYSAASSMPTSGVEVEGVTASLDFTAIPPTLDISVANVTIDAETAWLNFLGSEDLEVAITVSGIVHAETAWLAFLGNDGITVLSSADSVDFEAASASMGFAGDEGIVVSTSSAGPVVVEAVAAELAISAYGSFYVGTKSIIEVSFDADIEFFTDDIETLDQQTSQSSSRITGYILTTGRYELQLPPLSAAQVPELLLRAVPQRVVVMGAQYEGAGPNTTAIINGTPIGLPTHWIRPESDMTVTGSTYDPASVPFGDDSEDPDGSGGGADWRWLASDLALPTDRDGYNLSTWPEHNGGPSWKSSGVYRPNVRKRRFPNKKGKGYVVWDKSVYFDYTKVNHMWINLGDGGSGNPLTIVMLGIIHSYPSARYGHYLMDAGKPSPVRDVNEDWSIGDGNLGYRNAMLFQRTSALIGSHTLSDLTYGKHVRSGHNFRTAPRMFFGSFAGSKSHVGSMDPKNTYFETGPTNNHSPRYLVMGRRQGNISDNLSSHMSMVEIRMFKRNLTKKQLKRQYKQMAARYKISQMRNSR